MRKIGLFFAVIVAIVAFVFLSAIPIYNGIISTNENMTARWAQVESQLQRRGDLIPNLVETVKGYAAHEKEVFEYVAEARSKLAGARTIPQKVEAYGMLDSALSRLLAIAERYPDLKASANFIRLQDELAGTENRIAVERMRYNEAVRDYNIKIRTFPGNVIAGIFNFKVATEYFKAEEGAKEVPKVKF